ncbi:hypothetical protein RKD23_001062 [Streptomyces sp. SAI-170]
MTTEAPGSARLVLARNVVHLDSAAAVFEAMRDGWARQQAARFLKAKTIDPRLRLVQRLEEFTGLHPWQWTPAEGEAFIAHLRSGTQPIQMSTARTYEVTISLFLEYLLDRRYGWIETCLEKFGGAPREVFHEGNSVLIRWSTRRIPAGVRWTTTKFRRCSMRLTPALPGCGGRGGRVP